MALGRLAEVATQCPHDLIRVGSRSVKAQFLDIPLYSCRSVRGLSPHWNFRTLGRWHHRDAGGDARQ